MRAQAASMVQGIEHRQRARVTAVKPSGHATTIEVHRAGEDPVDVVVGAAPDTDRAMHWLRAFRRIVRVELHVTPDSARSTVHAIGHRLPVTRAVPVDVCLGLALLGVPVLVDAEAS